MTHIKYFILLFLVVCSSINVAAQVQDSIVNQKTVSGIVYDAETNIPMEIVAIDNGNYSSTFTELDGSFIIKVRSLNDVLSVKALGYTPKEVNLAGRDSVIIYMTSVGYPTFQDQAYLFYSTPKLYKTAQSVASVSVQTQFQNSLKTGAESGASSFKGKIAGVDVVARSGIPGVGSDIFLRGYSSYLGNNRPLIIVDGMIMDDSEYGEPLISGGRQNALGAIDVNDIENITVVRDANSIYGTKASNGVIYIRTLHATEQSNSIELNMYGGMNIAPQGLPLLESDDYRIYLYEMLESYGLLGDSINKLPYMIENPNYTDYYKYHNNTDWQKEVFANSYSKNVGLKIKGGDEVALYALSVNYLDNQATIKNTGFSRFSMRFNSDINISKVFSLNSNISFVRGDRTLMSGLSFNGTGNPMYAAMIKSPIFYPKVKAAGNIITPNYEDYDPFGVSNPTAILEGEQPMEQVIRNYKVFGSFNLNSKINKNLTVSNMVGILFDKNRELSFIPDYGVAEDTVDIGIVYNKNGYRTLKQFNVYNDFRINYINKFGDIHDLNALLGARINLNSVEEDWGTGANTPSDQITSVGKGDERFNKSGGFMNDMNNLSFYSAINYGLFNRYFVTVNMALETSSNFGDEADGTKIGDNVYGFFPSIAGAWVISSEEFLSSIRQIDLLKLRASYGITGNDDIGLNNRHKYYVSKNILGQQSIIRGNIYNPGIKWETNTKLDVGLDLEMLKSRLTLSVDYYKNKTEDMVEKVTTSIFAGEDNYFYNNGSFETKGFDIGIQGRILNGAVKWDLGGTISKYKTEVLSISGGYQDHEIYGATIRTEVGQPLGVFYGYQTNGVYATTEDAVNTSLGNYLPNTDIVAFGGGDVIFVDNHFDNLTEGEFTSIIDENDRTIIGDPNPDFTGEVNTRLKYKGFTLFANVGFCVGNDVFNYMRYKLESMDSYNNQTQAVLNRWRTEGQITDIPKATYGDPMMNSRFSDRWIEDGSYIRLRNVTLSYQLPLKVSFLKQSEVYVTGTNLLTITKYRGLDPEFSLSNEALTRGIDIGMPPQAQAFLIGLRLRL